MFHEAPIPRVLAVEDDESIRGLLVAAMRREGLDVETADDGLQALRLCERTEYAVILLDLMMPVLNGFDFLAAFPRTAPEARSVVIIITAYDDRVIESLRSSRVHAIVRKPFDVQLLATLIREVASTWAAAQMQSTDPPPLKRAAEMRRPC